MNHAACIGSIHAEHPIFLCVLWHLSQNGVMSLFSSPYTTSYRTILPVTGNPFVSLSLFSCLDDDSCLSVSRTRKTFHRMGIDITTEDIERFWNRWTKNKSKTRSKRAKNRSNDKNNDNDYDNDSNTVVVRMNESCFVRLATARLEQMERAETAFDLLDCDEKGVVVMEDVQRVAQELGEDWTRDEIVEMIDLVDRGGDGLLTRDDLFRLAVKINL